MRKAQFLPAEFGALQNRLNGRFGAVIVGGFYVDYRGDGIVFEKRGCAVATGGKSGCAGLFEMRDFGIG